MDSVAGKPLLDVTPAAMTLAEDLLRLGPLPARAAVDALHISAATVHGMDYLLTWNLTHIANAGLRNRIERVCRSKGYEPPVICTPDELLEEAE